MAGPILITGAGSGFGKEVALRLAVAGHEVIADVEIIAQVSAVRAEARQRGAELRVEKMDVTDPGDRENAWTGASRSSSTTPTCPEAARPPTSRRSGCAASSR
ncbi:hypothetical protein GCM10012280_64680 [Wenjunlia tyrosinilytica]|uniref:Uncharacterized protein n=1 Tax=Wenjunlia tyrosinilytica TaxID=1544741 RepID=A0A918E1X1_9ACTN|nr:hypothetical protein GCM10012280_64680 [Wenjunlia tyrosinilytica]